MLSSTFQRLTGSILAVLIAAGALAQDGAQASKSKVGAKTPPKDLAKELPKLSPKELPPSTRARPDPSKAQYSSAPLFVRISEKVKDEKGNVTEPAVRQLERYLQEYFRRAGHPIAPNAEGAKYRLEGELEANFGGVLKVFGRPVAYKYKASAAIRVLGATGETLETFEVPEISEENVKSEESAFLNLRRRLAKLFWDQLSLEGKTFSNPEVVRMLRSLVLDPSAGETQTTEEIIRRIADIGFPAVPYLLEALTDNRVVRIPSSYPGLKLGSLDDLRVYHIADKGLEEIFQKVSRMGLSLGPEDPESRRLRLVITKGWEAEWRRFCKPYADSPNAHANKAATPPTDEAKQRGSVPTPSPEKKN